MPREKVIRILAERRAELAREFGVKSLGLFGSVARGDAGPASDVDLLVEFDRPVGYFGLFALQDHLESLLGCRSVFDARVAEWCARALSSLIPSARREPVLEASRRFMPAEAAEHLSPSELYRALGVSPLPWASAHIGGY